MGIIYTLNELVALYHNTSLPTCWFCTLIALLQTADKGLVSYYTAWGFSGARLLQPTHIKLSILQKLPCGIELGVHCTGAFVEEVPEMFWEHRVPETSSIHALLQL